MELAGHILERRGSVRYRPKSHIKSIFSRKSIKMSVSKKNDKFFINITVDNVR